MKELYILGSWIEIFGSFRYKYQISDIGSLQPKNNISNQFYIYKTQANNKLFEWIGDLQNGSRLPYENIECKLKIKNNLVISNGICTIDKVSNDKIYLIVRDSNIFFFEKIKGKSINDLDFADLDFIWNLNYFADSRTSEVLPVFLDYDFGLTKLDKAHQLPFLPLKFIFEKIITEAGYTYDFDFKNNSDFKNFYISFVNNLITEEYRDEAKYKALEAAAFNTLLNQGIYFRDINHYYVNKIQDPLVVCSTFIIKHDGDYEFSFKIYINSSGNASKLYLSNAGTNIVIDLAIGDNSIGRDITGTYKRDDEIYIWIKSNGDTIKVTANNISYIQMASIPDSVICEYGERYPVSINLPNILQSDIIKLVMRLYNLRINYENGNIEFLNFNKLSENIAKGEVVDWSDKYKDVLPRKFYHNFAKKNIIKYSNTNNKQGYFEINNEQIKDTKILYALPFDCENALLNFKREKENEGEADERYVYNFSSLANAIIVKRTLSDYSKDYFAYDETLNLTTNIPDIELINLQEYIDNNYQFLKNSLENYKNFDIEIWLNQVDVDNLDYSKAIFMKFLGFFYWNYVVFEKGKKTKVNLTQININPFIPNLLINDFDKRDFDGSDFE